MNIQQVLKTMAVVQGVSLDIVQKDYAISYLLAGIAGTPGLGEKIILKGGTALKKLYYPEYRFSEDLDFSTLELAGFPSGEELMKAAVSRMTVLLQERGPFETQIESMVLRQPHPAGQKAYIVRVRFPDQRQALCRLKVEITVDEPVLLPAKGHPILHRFSEPFKASTLGYELEEIVAEKLRALLQSRDKLTSRGWGASRVCRDYYDLWWILGREKLISVAELFARKCALRKVAYQSPGDLTHPDLIETARREWDQQLSPFLTAAPEKETVLAEVQVLISALFKHS
jgi:hypothetical protein